MVDSILKSLHRVIGSGFLSPFPVYSELAICEVLIIQRRAVRNT